MNDKERWAAEAREQVYKTFGVEPKDVMDNERECLLQAFPGSFINSRDEFIAHPRTNQYFILSDCKAPEDVKAKVLEWLSRPSCKTQPYSQEWRNRKFHTDMRFSVNAYLDTDFSQEDMELIYDWLGNTVNHRLTMLFIRNGMDVEWLREFGPVYHYPPEK